MALIKCKECGKKISSSAPNCPNCGCPKSKQNTIKLNKTAKIILIAIGIVLLIAVVISIVYYEIARKKAESAGLPTTFDKKYNHGALILY